MFEAHCSAFQDVLARNALSVLQVPLADLLCLRHRDRARDHLHEPREAVAGGRAHLLPDAGRARRWRIQPRSGQGRSR